MADDDDTDEVTLTLTRLEAQALNRLAVDGAYRQSAGLNNDDMGMPEEFDPAIAARAVDKLQRVVVPDLHKSSTITYLLKKIGVI